MSCALFQDTSDASRRPEACAEPSRRRAASGGVVRPISGSSPALGWPEARRGGYMPKSISRDFCFVPAAFSSSDSPATLCGCPPPRSGSFALAGGFPVPALASGGSARAISRRDPCQFRARADGPARARDPFRVRCPGPTPSRQARVPDYRAPFPVPRRARTRSPRRPVWPSRRAPRAAPRSHVRADPRACGRRR